MSSPTYKLFYWPHLPGRGEFVRLILEQAGAPYEDVARGPPQDLQVVADAKNGALGQVHYAPPILQISEDFSLSQTSVICAYLARKHGLVPEGDHKWVAAQIEHTVQDIVGEVWYMSTYCVLGY